MTDYYRFEPARQLNLISTSRANVIYDASEKLAVASGLESVYQWNIRTGILFKSWSDPDIKSEISYICPPSSANPSMYAIGYMDGSLRIWDAQDGKLQITFQGHKSAITAITWDKNGSKLASGSRDGDIIVWDILSESGKYRLRGHTNNVTSILFVNNASALVSSSKDTFVKVWDLSTQHCVETILVHHSDVISIHLLEALSQLITFSNDQQIRIFDFKPENISRIISDREADLDKVKVFDLSDSINRSSKERILGVAEHAIYFCLLTADKRIEVLKKNMDEVLIVGKKSSIPKKALSSIRNIRFQNKPISIDVSKKSNKGSLKILLNYPNNLIEEWVISLDSQVEPERVNSVEFVGHRSDIKALSINSDDTLLMSVSNESSRIWNIDTGACIRSFPCEEALSAAFVPDNKSVIIGDKFGRISMYDLLSGNCTLQIEGHSGPAWSICVSPDQKGFLSSSSDKSVKFWEFKKDKKSGHITKVKHVKTLQLSEEVLCVRYSPDMRLIAVALLDMTVKVFFEDSLKLSLSLYGHKLPVTAMEIATDNSTIITVSNDKNIKIWSLQFGDCRKSIFAHQEGITGVAFLNRGQEFVTAGKDKVVRYWDAKKFQSLQKLTGHHGEVWCLAASRSGDFIISASHDKSIRIWKRSDELLFPEEEKEKEIEEMMDASMLTENRHEGDQLAGAEQASKPTIDSMKAGERLVEAIEVADIERQKAADQALAKEYGQTIELLAPEPLLLAAGKDKTPAELVLWAFEKIPLADIEESLMCLPTALVSSLLVYITEWLTNRLSVVLASRILDFLLKVHFNQIIADENLRMRLGALKSVQCEHLRGFKDTLGLNIISLRAISQL